MPTATFPTAAPSQSGSALSQTDSLSPKRLRKWIYGPAADFFLIHGALGLIVLPIAAASFLAPDIIPILLVAYTLFLGMPHITATHVRLHLDEDCRRQHRWLAIVAPLAVAGLVAAVVYAWKMLPALVLSWFLIQNWHAGRQNFGIMRRYIRMAGSDPNKPVNRPGRSRH